MHRTPARWLVVLVVSLACLAGCQDGTATTPPPATPTPEPIVTPAAPPPTSPVADRFNAREEPYEPGRYTRGQFVPRVTFEVGRDWVAVEAAARFWRIGLGGKDDPEAVALMFARPDGIYRGPGQLVAPGTAQAAADAIAANPSVEVLGSSESLMSGLSGLVLELESAGAEAQVLHVPPGALTLSPGSRMWVALFDTPEGLVAVLVQGSADDWDAVLETAEPVLESVTIGL